MSSFLTLFDITRSFKVNNVSFFESTMNDQGCDKLRIAFDVSSEKIVQVADHHLTR